MNRLTCMYRKSKYKLDLYDFLKFISPLFHNKTRHFKIFLQNLNRFFSSKIIVIQLDT